MNDQSPQGPQSLGDLIASRLCHDLVNPLGAIGNGVELIEMTGSVRGPEMDLIRDAVRDAHARMRFLRIAFGASGATQVLSAREARMTALAPWQGTRMALDWSVRGDLPRVQVKLGYLTLLCAETALPMGGTVTLGQDAGGQWRLDAEAPRVAMDEALWSVLRFGMGAAGRALRPSEVQFPALHAAADPLGQTVNYIAREDGLTITTA
jgi:histidine phosphotransferase ChpT